MDLSEYETYLEQQVESGNLSERTQRAYYGAMEQYADYLGHGDIGSAPLSKFQEYCLDAAAGEIGEEKAGTSLNVAKFAYRKVLNLSDRLEDYERLKFWFSEHFQVSSSGESDHFTTDELDAVRRAAASDPRDAALVAILSETGCRVGEIIRLDRDDVTFDPDLDAPAAVRIRPQKRTDDVANWRPLTRPESAEAINDYLDALPEYVHTDAAASAALFPSHSKTSVESTHIPSGVSPDGHDADGPYTWRATDVTVNGWLKDIADRADHENVDADRMHAHLFRHTVGTHLGEEGYSAEQIGAFLGRQSAAKEYVHLEDSGVVLDMAAEAP